MALKHCRCCCATIRLEQATKIIGVVFTVLGVISLVASIVALARQDAGSDELVAQLETLLEHEDALSLVKHARTLLIVRLCVTLIFTGFSVLLVIGVKRHSRPLVLTFVIFFFIYMTLNTIYLFYAYYDPTALIDESTLAELQKQSRDIAKAAIYVGLTVVLVLYVFLWYLAVVIFSFYKEMAKRGPAPEHRQMV